MSFSRCCDIPCVSKWWFKSVLPQDDLTWNANKLSTASPLCFLRWKALHILNQNFSLWLGGICFHFLTLHLMLGEFWLRNPIECKELKLMSIFSENKAKFPQTLWKLFSADRIPSSTFASFCSFFFNGAPSQYHLPSPSFCRNLTKPSSLSSPRQVHKGNSIACHNMIWDMQDGSPNCRYQSAQPQDDNAKPTNIPWKGRENLKESRRK